MLSHPPQSEENPNIFMDMDMDIWIHNPQSDENPDTNLPNCEKE